MQVRQGEPAVRARRTASQDKRSPRCSRARVRASRSCTAGRSASVSISTARNGTPLSRSRPAMTGRCVRARTRIAVVALLSSLIARLTSSARGPLPRRRRVPGTDEPPPRPRPIPSHAVWTRCKGLLPPRFFPRREHCRESLVRPSPQSRGPSGNSPTMTAAAARRPRCRYAGP